MRQQSAPRKTERHAARGVVEKTKNCDRLRLFKGRLRHLRLYHSSNTNQLSTDYQVRDNRPANILAADTFSS